MYLIQFLLVIGITVAAVLGTRALPQDSSLAVKRIIVGLFVIAAVLAIIFPELLSRVAGVLGVGRGTDLLLYVFIIASLLYTVAAERKRSRQDAKFTELSRAVALLEARLTEKQEDPRP